MIRMTDDFSDRRSERERGRLVTQGKRTDDNSKTTLLLIHEADDSWTFHGLGAPGSVFHLLRANDDLTCSRGGWVTLCGEVFRTPALPPSCFPLGGEYDRDPLLPGVRARGRALKRRRRHVSVACRRSAGERAAPVWRKLLSPAGGQQRGDRVSPVPGLQCATAMLEWRSTVHLECSCGGTVEGRAPVLR